MQNQIFHLKDLTISPVNLSLYIPPIVWRGDSVGHIGENDLFFWVLEGECFLNIDSKSHIIRPNQLAFLPKGKMRAYTHASEHFSMYEMAFSATVGNENLMSILGLCDQNFVVDVPNPAEVTALFENSNRIEYTKDPLHGIRWCANIANLISIYTEERRKLSENDNSVFKTVFEYMSNNLSAQIKTEDLAALVYMQPTYFIKKFGEAYGLPPMTYLNRMRMYKAMGMLAGTSKSIEQISHEIGISDVSYFARVFKKHCGISPTAYRAEFKKI